MANDESLYPFLQPKYTVLTIFKISLEHGYSWSKILNLISTIQILQYESNLT